MRECPGRTGSVSRSGCLAGHPAECERGFSSEANNSNPYETSLALLALRLATPSASVASAATWLRNAQLPDGSWGGDSAQTALAVQALRLAPVVSTIPSQSVISPATFTAISR